MLSGTILAASSQAELVHNLAGVLGADLVTSDVRVFPDGESKIRLSGQVTGRCVVVQSVHPPVDANLVRALLMVSEAAGRADGVAAVVPYMGYARQDREFLPGEVVTLRHVAKLFVEAGADMVVTVDIHSMRGLEYFGGIGRNVSAVPELARYFADMELDGPVAVSPDMGGQERARLFAESMGTDWLALEKRRDRTTGEVVIQSDAADVSGRDIILVDDMISTGGSMIKAATFLKTCGCRSIFAACTHALMVNEAASRMAEAGIAKVVAANTIPNPASVVDVSGVVAEALSGHL